MRLERIEAVRYGGLADASLGELADGLNLVFGHNEAGKTSFMTLVRHVLYGFPRKNATERTYLAAGGRHGRLVFADRDGEWAIERVDGANRGPVGVTAISGPPRPDILDKLTAGVDEATYHTVFGFGADDLAEAGSLDALLARLVAAAMGLGVSPQAVRESLDAEAGKLWAAGASVRTVNRLMGQVAEKRKELAEIERASSELISERDRLAELAARLVDTEAELVSSTSRVEALRIVEDRLDTGRADAEKLEDRVRRLEEGIAESRRRIGGLSPDRAALEAAADIDAVSADLSGFAEWQQALRRAESSAETAERELGQLLAREGWTREQIAAARAGSESAEVVTRFERELTTLSAQVQADRRVAEAGATSGPPRVGAGPAWAVWIVVGAGLLLAVAGALTRQWLAVVAGVAAAGGGAFAAVRRGSATPDGAPRTQATGSAADTAYARKLAEWHAWLDESGLPSQTRDDPAATAAVLRQMLTARELEAAAAAARSEVTNGSVRAEAFCSRVLAAVGPVLPEVGGVAPDDVRALVTRAGEIVVEARAVAARREALSSGIVEAERELADASGDLARLGKRTSEAILAAGLPPDADLPSVRVALQAADAGLAERTAERSTVAEERARISERLDAAAHEDRAEQLRLQVAGLTEQAAAAADRYVVLAVASALLQQAQQTYMERHHPGVMRAAESAFAMMTAGRYTHISVPLGGGAIEVVERGERVKGVGELSKGTADQLYLSLRIGLLDGLDNAGASLPVLMDDVLVHFDDERMLGAARAIADLATRRQVLVFACRQETADALAKAAPGRTLIELG